MKTIYDLFGLMVRSSINDGVPNFVYKGKTYIFLGADREDGSGLNFNVRAYDDHDQPITLFVKLTR